MEDKHQFGKFEISFFFEFVVLTSFFYRPYWRCYYSNTDAIIYVVDSADRDRIGISKDELLYMLREEELAGAILVVLANKQDMEGCMSVAEVHQALGLEQLKNRTFQVYAGTVFSLMLFIF